MNSLKNGTTALDSSLASDKQTLWNPITCLCLSSSILMLPCWLFFGNTLVVYNSKYWNSANVTLICIMIEAALQIYWNHTLAWVFSCKFAAYSQNFLIRTSMEGSFCNNHIHKEFNFRSMWNFWFCFSYQVFCFTSYISTFHIICYSFLLTI